MAPAVSRRLHPDFCNKIGTNRTTSDVRCSVAIGGGADMARTAQFDFALRQMILIVVSTTIKALV